MESISIIGAGPVGLIAALRFSQERDVQLIASRPEPTDIGRIDALPAGFLALLVELGVHPRELGVDVLHSSFMASWESEAPVLGSTAAKAHVDRRQLERQLWRLVRSRLSIQVVSPGQLREGGLVIDATGRRAITATDRVEPPQPWVARTATIQGRFSQVHQALRIAAVPEGYFYRLGVGDTLTIGFVGPQRRSADSAECLLATLGDRQLEWMLSGLRTAGSPISGRGGKATVQWSIGKASPIRIGDASLACDALSSHGIAGGVAQAMRVTSRPNAGNGEGQRRRAHLQNLHAMIEQCRWRNEPAWAEYAGFLSSSIHPLGETTQ